MCVLQQIRTLFMNQAVAMHGLDFSFCRGLRGATESLNKGQGDEKRMRAPAERHVLILTPAVPYHF
jgi:hypothetical protein